VEGVGQGGPGRGDQTATEPADGVILLADDRRRVLVEVAER